MKIIIKITLVSIITLYCCNTNKETALEKGISDIEKSWTRQQLDSFSKKDINKALSDIHFGYALYYRNKYFRSPKDSTLLNYFRALNIEHEDHMSGIVFASLHRKLNNKDIDLNSQLESIYKIQNEIKKNELKNHKRAIRYIQKYKIGDTIQVRRPIDERRNAIQYSYPENSGWVYNDSLDFILKGRILKRNILKDSSQMFYNVKVLSKNNNKVKVLMKEVNIGDTIQIDIDTDIIEDIRGNGTE